MNHLAYAVERRLPVEHRLDGEPLPLERVPDELDGCGRVAYEVCAAF